MRKTIESVINNGGMIDTTTLDTKPKVPNVTLEVVGGSPTLDDQGSTSTTFDYPELLSPEELAAYEAWMQRQSTPTGGGVGGGGKYMDLEDMAAF